MLPRPATTPRLPREAFNESGVSVTESRTHSFVIRIWMEETDGPPTWRGQITHVMSGNRRYFSDPREVVSFLLLYLDERGIDQEEPRGSG